MKVLFLGTPSFSLPTLQSLLDGKHDVVAVLTRRDRPRGRSGRPQPPPVKEEALRAGVPVLQPQRVNGARTYAAVRDLAPDVAVVVAFGRLLSPEFLALPPHGCINVHASLLPAYRGAAPIQWAVARGEAETGVSVMQMDEGLDTGDILLQRATPIAPEESAEALGGRLAVMGGVLLLETLEELAAGSLRRRPQIEAEASLAPLLRREDARIDWRRHAAEIGHLVRGMQPWPVAHARAGERWLRVFGASPAAAGEARAVPGTIVGARDDAALVACGGGSLLALRLVQPESRRRMTGREAINGRALSVGDVLA